MAITYQMVNIDVVNKQIVQSFTSSVSAGLPTVYLGPLPLFLRFMAPTGIASAPYTDVDYSVGTTELGFGSISTAPTAGTFTINDPDAAQTTAAIPITATNTQIQSAINLALTTNYLTATVTGSGPSFTVVATANGNRSNFIITTGLLTPVAVALVCQPTVGTSTNPVQQYVKIIQQPYAYTASWTAAPAAGVNVVHTQTGSVTQSDIQTISLLNTPYKGTFTLTFGGYTTTPIAYNASIATVQTILQALTSIGSGNCIVGGTTGGPWIVTFTGTLGNAAQAVIVANATGLTSPLGLLGTINVNTASVQQALGLNNFFSDVLEIDFIPAGGSLTPVIQTSLTVSNQMITGTPATPTPTPTYPLLSYVNTNFVQNAFGITSLTGGVSGDLDAIATAGGATGVGTTLVIANISTLNGGAATFWQLQSGTAAAVTNSIVHPVDYNSSTNAVIWVRQG